MVGYQRPCIADALGLLEDSSQSLQKVIPVGIASEDTTPLHAPDHDVVQGTSGRPAGRMMDPR